MLLESFEDLGAQGLDLGAKSGVGLVARVWGQAQDPPGQEGWLAVAGVQGDRDAGMGQRGARFHCGGAAGAGAEPQRPLDPPLTYKSIFGNKINKFFIYSHMIDSIIFYRFIGNGIGFHYAAILPSLHFT